MLMRDWQFLMILLGVYYQVGNLFPVPYRKWNLKKDRFVIDNNNIEFKRQWASQCIVLDVYEKTGNFA